MPFLSFIKKFLTATHTTDRPAKGRLEGPTNYLVETTKRCYGGSYGYTVSKRTGRRNITYWGRREIWQHFGRKCYHCGKKLKSSDGVHMQVDHLIPLAKGGTNDDDNLFASCPQCNLSKSSKLPRPERNDRM
jgi:5-methylcytosine-specific restriction endonuclease McrA